MSASRQTESIHQLVGPRLAEREIRYTTARQLVVLALNEASGPMAVSDLHAALGDDVPLSSLYRTLAVLEESDVLHRQHDTDGIARYELAEWLKGHHHHLVCTDCGAVADVAISSGLEARVGAIVTALATDQGWTATGHRVDIEGRCPACST